MQLAIKPYQIAPFVRERARLTAVIVSERWRGAMTISRRKPRPRRRWRCLAWCGVRTYIRLARRELEMQLQSRLLAHLVSHSLRRPRALDHVSPPASKRKWCHLCTTPPNSLILSLTFCLPETCHKVWAPFVSGSEQIFFYSLLRSYLKRGCWHIGKGSYSHTATPLPTSTKTHKECVNIIY